MVVVKWWSWLGIGRKRCCVEEVVRRYFRSLFHDTEHAARLIQWARALLCFPSFSAAQTPNINVIRVR